MKNIKEFRSIMLGLIVILMTSFIPNGETQKAYDPTGTWDYEVETDEGTLTGAMTITRDEDNDLGVSIETDQFGTLELEDIELKDKELSASVELEGDVIDFEFEFDGESMEGIVSTPDGDLSISAERRKKK